MVFVFSSIMKFLLTRLLRGATSRDGEVVGEIIDFYSRASYEARLDLSFEKVPLSKFLLTRLLRGATRPMTEIVETAYDFYSRASYEARRMTAIQP